MLNNKFVPFKREQFTLLAKAKRLVLEEFGDELSLQDKNLVRKIKTYASESTDSRLKDIYDQLNIAAQPQVKKSPIQPRDKENNKSQAKNTGKIQVGDMVDGKLCVGLYRGQPVFK